MANVPHATLSGTDLHRPVRFTQETAPASASPGDQWLTPSTGVLKQRNEAGDGWITIADAQSHEPATVTDTSSINLSISGQAISADAIFGTSAGTVAEGDHTHAATSTLNIVIDGGGAAITPGVKLDVVLDFAATITAATLLADQSGSIVIDLWKDSYANFPPTVADSITASAKPTLSSAQTSHDTTLTGWTTAISAGDILRVNVDSASTVQRVVLALTLERTI